MTSSEHFIPDVGHLPNLVLPSNILKHCFVSKNPITSEKLLNVLCSSKIAYLSICGKKLFGAKNTLKKIPPIP